MDSSTQSTQSIPLELQMKISSLQSAILESHPTMPLLLRDIHKILKEDPAVVTILSEEEICAIVTGLKKQTATEITQATLKKSTKSLSKTSADDL